MSAAHLGGHSSSILEQECRLGEGPGGEEDREGIWDTHQESAFWRGNIQTDTGMKSWSRPWDYFTQVAGQFSRLLYLIAMELWRQGWEEDAHWQTHSLPSPVGLWVAVCPPMNFGEASGPDVECARAWRILQPPAMPPPFLSSCWFLHEPLQVFPRAWQSARSCRSPLGADPAPDH